MPKVVLVITLDNDNTKNKSHGTIFEKPVKHCLISIVFVSVAISIVNNKNAIGRIISSIIPAIEITNKIIM